MNRERDDAVEHARAADGWSNILSGYSPPRMATIEAVRQAIFEDCLHVTATVIAEIGHGTVYVHVDAPGITADADRRILAINVKHAAERAMAAATHVSEVVVNGYRIEVSS